MIPFKTVWKKLQTEDHWKVSTGVGKVSDHLEDYYIL